MGSGRVHNFISIFILILVSVLLSSMLCATEARPLLQGSRLHRDAIGGSENLFAGRFSLGAKKRSGPSPGIGHRYQNVNHLGQIKNSGPSPGEGHKSTVTGNKH